MKQMKQHTNIQLNKLGRQQQHTTNNIVNKKHYNKMNEIN